MNPYSINEQDKTQEIKNSSCSCCRLSKANCVGTDSNWTSYALYTIRELFLWSLWTSHLELSFHFWKRLAHPIIAALVAYKILDNRKVQMDKHIFTKQDCSHYSK